MKIFCLSVALLLCLTSFSCQEQTTIAPELESLAADVAYIELTTDLSSIEVGKPVQLEAVAYDAESSPIEGAKIDWSSSDDALVEINDDGTITAHDLGRAVITASCGETLQKKVVSEPYRVLYFNSFERTRDTADWEYDWGSLRLSGDVPPKTGALSLYVSGGCVMPTAQIEIPARPRPSYVTISAYGKVLENNGSIGLMVLSPYAGIACGFSGDVWRWYKPVEPLLVPANVPMYVTASSGGFIGGSALVDLIEVREIAYFEDSESDTRDDL